MTTTGGARGGAMRGGPRPGPRGGAVGAGRVRELPLGTKRFTDLRARLSQRTMCNPERAEDLRAAYQPRLGEACFRAGVANGRFAIAHG